MPLVYFLAFFTFGFAQHADPDSLSLNIDSLSPEEKIDIYISNMYEKRDVDILKVLDYYDKAVKIAVSNNLKPQEARLHFLAAGQYNLMYNTSKSEELFYKAISIWDSLKYYEQKTHALNNLAWVYGTIGDEKRSLMVLKEALKISKSLGDQDQQAFLKCNMFESYLAMDSLDAAVYVLQEALETYKKTNNEFRVGTTLRNLAEAYYFRKEYGKGISACEMALEHLGKFDEDYDLQSALRLLALNYSGIGKFYSAHEAIDKAIQISNSLKNDLIYSDEFGENLITKAKILSRQLAHSEAERFMTAGNKYLDSVSVYRNFKMFDLFQKRYDKERQEAVKRTLQLAVAEEQSFYLSISTFLAVVIAVLFIVGYYSKKKTSRVLELQKNELEILNEKFKAFFQQSETAIRLMDVKGEVILWNAAAEKLTGIGRNEALGTRMLKIFRWSYCYVKNEKTSFKDTMRLYIKAFETLRRDELFKPQNIIGVLNTKEGSTKYVQDLIFPIRTKTHKFVGGISYDITKQKEYEQQLVDAKDKAELSDRLKSEFLSQISHEIRTPVNSLLNMTSLIEKEVKEEINKPEIFSCFDGISNAGYRLVRTIDMLIQMSELQSGDYNVSNSEIYLYKDVVNPIIFDYLQIAEDKGIKLSCTDYLKSKTVKSDAYALQNIIGNLVDNAIKYTEQGEVQIILDDKNGNVVVTVEDTGIGIDEQYLPNLFEIFSQEEQGYTRKYDGTGLGLSIVKSYCELIDIKIKYESYKGKGSRFQLII